MQIGMLAYSSWILQKDHLAVCFIALGTLCGWPFFAAVGIPIAIDIVVVRHKFKDFLASCLLGVVYFAVCLLPRTLSLSLIFAAVAVYYRGRFLVL